MTLSSDIYICDLRKAPCKLERNTGTEKPYTKDLFGGSYYDDAFVPKWKWETEAEKERLQVPNSDCEVGKTLIFDNIPDLDLTDLYKIIQDDKNPKGSGILKKSPVCVSICQEVTKYISKYFQTDNYVMHDIVCNEPGLLTTSYNNTEEGRKYVGLHFDLWDCLPYNKTHLARNRICVNLGTEKRVFTFINLSLAKIISSLSEYLSIDLT
jgi:hypothetical protein